MAKREPDPTDKMLDELLKGKTPFSLAEIKSILYSRAIDMGEPGMDNIFGWGRLNLRR